MATEYISREAAISLIDQHCFESGYDAVWMEEALKDTPAADVVEVVRCMDCIYGDPDPSTSSEIFCEKHCRWLSKNHYCADGKRRQP